MNANGRVFNISDADGVNESERLLMRLCRSSFLSLWSSANLHTDQDMRNGKGSAKEYADVLVVFGDDVIIFSDKHIPFQTEKPVDIAWRRWYSRAIVSSAKQLHGAMNWTKRFPSRVFIDSKCTVPVPVEIPDASRARYHLVAVTRGSREANIAFFEGGHGSLHINSKIAGDVHEETPFSVGIVSPGQSFVHVLDEFALEVVMQEMDTVSDFVAYLKDREILLNGDLQIIAPGEENLLSAYLMYADENGRRFLPNTASEHRGIALFDSSFYDNLRVRPEYQAKKHHDKISYLWDQLLESLIRLGDPSIGLPAGYSQSSTDIERGLRLMAARRSFE